MNVTEIQFVSEDEIKCEPACVSCPKCTHDVCWEETSADSYTEWHQCPLSPYTTDKNVFRRYCNITGHWEVPHWGACVPDELLHESNQTSFEMTPTFEQLEFYLRTIRHSRILGTVGFTLSWFSLLAALIIFASFRSLRCNRTKIHIHLFVAMLVRITTEIATDLSQFFKFNSENQFSGFHQTEYVCQVLYVVNSYFNLCAFAWMLVEGVYLNTLISSASVFGRPNFIRYYILGWGVPVIFDTAWTIAMVFTEKEKCWDDHTNNKYYFYLLEVPRNIMFILNSGFLLHIIYVLVTKLKNNNSGETQVIRKAVKALVVLVPLMGICNLIWGLDLPEPTQSRAVIILYLYVNRTLYAFQGFAIALLFCFLNKEVRGLMKRKWRIFRDSPVNRRTSMITSTSDISTRGHRGANGRPGSSTFDSLHRPKSVETLT